MTRDLTYDGLRGWLLIIIACNHLYGGFVPQLTRAPFGLVTAAEGFVFLSGFVAYLVYGRLATNVGLLKRKIWQRSFTIYTFHIGAITITFLLAWLFPLYVSQWSSFFNAGNWFSVPGQSMMSALLLLEQPGYHDILILYLVPMIVLPFAITTIKKGKAIYVALLSVSVWLIAQFVSAADIAIPLQKILPGITMNISYFDPLAWQIYFFMGVLLSYLKFDKGITFNFPIWIKITILTIALSFFVAKHWAPEFLQSISNGHGEASLIYQLNLLVLVYVFMLLMRHSSWLFKLKYPVFLGQHALPVFAFHAIVIYFLQPFSEPFITQHWYADVLTCLLFVALLAIPAKLDQSWRKYKLNKSRKMVSINS